MHLNKFLAHAGVCSRRRAIQLIKDGVVKVNDKTVANPAYLVLEDDIVKVSGKLVRREEKIYILLNKPRGVVTTSSDEKNRKTVLDVIGNKVKQRIYPIGRLDINTTGVLILTNDGELAQKLAHPKYEIAKVYHVTLHRELSEIDRKQIITGLKLDDGLVKIDTLSMPFGPKKDQVKIKLHSGKYHIVRRIFESLGYFVKKLDRISFAGITKIGISVGLWRKLRKIEVEKLKRLSLKSKA